MTSSCILNYHWLLWLSLSRTYTHAMRGHTHAYTHAGFIALSIFHYSCHHSAGVHMFWGIIWYAKCPVLLVSLLCTTVIMLLHLLLSKPDFKVSHDRQGFRVWAENKLNSEVLHVTEKRFPRVLQVKVSDYTIGVTRGKRQGGRNVKPHPIYPRSDTLQRLTYLLAPQSACSFE